MQGSPRRQLHLPHLLSVAVVLLFAPVLFSHVPAVAEADSVETYPLRSASRNVPARGRVKCPDLPRIRHRSDLFRYNKPVNVHPAFAERLKRFEAVVSRTAVEFYGRPPTRIVHLGTYNCRRIRTYPTWISEHGLGNAIDIAGFDFGRMPSDVDWQGPKRLRRGFPVRVLKHWNARGKAAQVHREFLRTLAKRLIARDDIFHVLLGPAFPGHANHFHFDCSIFRMEHIFTPL